MSTTTTTMAPASNGGSGRTFSLKQRVTKAAQVVRKLSTQPLVSPVPEAPSNRVKSQDTPPSYTTSPESPHALALRKSAGQAGQGQRSDGRLGSGVTAIPSPRFERQFSSPAGGFEVSKHAARRRQHNSNITNSIHFRQAILGGSPPPLHGEADGIAAAARIGLSIQGLDGQPETGSGTYQETYLPQASLGPAFVLPALDGLGLMGFGEEDILTSSSEPKTTAIPLTHDGHAIRSKQPSRQGTRPEQQTRSSGEASPTRLRARPSRNSSSSTHTLEIKLTGSQSSAVPPNFGTDAPIARPEAQKHPKSHTDLREKVADFKRRESAPHVPTTRVGFSGPIPAFVDKRRSVAGDMRQTRLKQTNRSALRDSLYKPLPQQPQQAPASAPPPGFCIRPSVSAATQTPAWWPTSSSSSSAAVTAQGPASSSCAPPSSAVHKWSDTPPQAYSAFPIADLAQLGTPAYTESYPSPSVYSVADTADHQRSPEVSSHARWNSSFGRNDWSKIIEDVGARPKGPTSRRASSSSGSPIVAPSASLSTARVSPATMFTPNVQAEIVRPPSPTLPITPTKKASPPRPSHKRFSSQPADLAASPPWTKTSPEGAHSLRTTRSASMQAGHARRGSSIDWSKRGSLPSDSLDWTEGPARPYVRPRPVSVFNPLYKPSVPFQPEKKLAPIDYDSPFLNKDGTRVEGIRSAPGSRRTSRYVPNVQQKDDLPPGEEDSRTPDESPVPAGREPAEITFTTPFTAPDPPSKIEHPSSIDESARTGVDADQHSPRSNSLPVFTSPKIIPATPIPSSSSLFIPAEDSPILAPIARRASPNLTVDVNAAHRRSTSTTPPPRPLPSPLRRASLAPSPDGSTMSQRRKSMTGPPVNPPSPMRRLSMHSNSSRGPSPTPPADS